jgi:FkbM family methyltransferase
MLSLPARILRAYLRTRLRGRTRLTFLVARNVRSLQAVPIQFGDCRPAYVDLRDGQAHGLLRGHPWPHAPWEVAEQEVMRSVVSLGQMVLDIGANLGLHSVLLSKLVGLTGRLHAFEPNPALLATLRLTIAGLGNATLHPFALSSRAGTATFFVPADHQKGSLADWLEPFGGSATPVACEQRRLDDLVRDGTVPQPDFIKCDVEGAELLVFEGARSTLDRRDAPIVLFEANAYNARGFGFSLLDARDFLRALSLPHYHFFEVLEAGGCLPLHTVRTQHLNILAVPDSKRQQFPKPADLRA